MTISVFPKPYEDELIYSLLARYHCISGNTKYMHSAEDLYVNKDRKPNIEFYNPLKEEMISKLGNLDEIILNHTLFKQYARFISSDRKRKSFDTLKTGKGTVTNYLYRQIDRNSNDIKKLRYCPICADEDREVNGETYWKCTHQLYGVTTCIKHNCYLIETDIPISSKSSPNLFCADLIIPKENKTKSVKDSKEVLFSKYVVDLFNEPLSLDQDKEISRLFLEKISKTKYSSSRCETIKLEELCNDVFVYLSDYKIDLIYHNWQVSKIIRGKRLNTSEIAAIAMFLNITSQELANMEYPEKKPQEIFDEELHRLHFDEGLGFAEISRMKGWDYDYIKALVYKRNKKKRKVVNNGGIKSRDYKALDKQYLPIVKETVKDFKNSTLKKPRKISVMGIEKEIGLPEGSVKNMQYCYTYIQNNIEPIEAYWVRCLNWSYNQLVLNNENLSKTKLIKPLNIKNNDVERICLYIKDYNPIIISEEILGLLQLKQ